MSSGLGYVCLYGAVPYMNESLCILIPSTLAPLDLIFTAHQKDTIDKIKIKLI